VFDFLKILKTLLLFFGLYILFVTVRTVGTQNLFSELYVIRWQLLPLLLIYPFIYALNTLGWKLAYPKDLPAHIPFGGLAVIRIIGETLNNVIPWAASLGGEPFKAHLLKRKYGVSATDTMASLLIVHTTLWLSLNSFVIGALIANAKTRPLTPLLWNSVLVFLGVLGAFAGALAIGLHWGIFKQIHSLGKKWKWLGGYTEKKGDRLFELDEEIKKFYTSDRWRFWYSSFFNFLAWWVGCLEVYFLGKILGIQISILDAWLLEALIQVLRIVTFFIPASIGAQEGGIVFIFSQLGFAHPVSFLFAMIRRLREMIWIGVGLLLWTLIDRSILFRARTPYKSS
jgi:glycosyltransferase 2 family protein